ncbi:MAG: hypothetical protein JWN40_1886 [Phycisphaerales bacterium]|nr:hypothetical protein [Phycisphaerales bacterium]
MAQVAARLIFWKANTGADSVKTGKQLCAGVVPSNLAAIDGPSLFAQLKSVRGFARVGMRDQLFFLENARAEVSIEGVIYERHLDVRFYGNFEVLAKPLFKFMSRQGLLCYADGDREMLREWPAFEEPDIDVNYSARMQRVLARQNRVVLEQESDPKRRAKIMTAFLRSDEFQREMAREYDIEKQTKRGKG